MLPTSLFFRFHAAGRLYLRHFSFFLLACSSPDPRVSPQNTQQAQASHRLDSLETVPPKNASLRCCVPHTPLRNRESSCLYTARRAETKTAVVRSSIFIVTGTDRVVPMSSTFVGVLTSCILHLTPHACWKKNVLHSFGTAAVSRELEISLQNLIYFEKLLLR